MKNIFKLRIDNLTDIIVSEEGDSEFPVDVSFGTVTLVDRFWSVEDAKSAIKEILEFYNEELWKDPVLLNMMVRYLHHIKSYNNEGWTKRLDFHTPDLYKAFISGLEMSIRGYITEKMNNKFVPERDYSAIHKMYIEEYMKEEVANE